MDTTTLPSSLQLLFASGRLSKKSTQSQPSLLVLRHADRGQVAPNCFGTELSLTQNGRAKARQLGACLYSCGISPGVVLTSTCTTRTMQTLLSICAGAKWTDRIEDIVMCARVDGALFDSNFRFKCLREIGNNHSGHFGAETIHFFNDVLSEKVAFNGIKPFEQGALAQLTLLKELLDRQKKQSEPRGLSILVAHDLNLVYLLAYCFKIKEFSLNTWPPFLDGVLIRSSPDNDNGIIISYGNQTVEIIV